MECIEGVPPEVYRALHGARFSVRDGIALVLAGALVAWLLPRMPPLAWLVVCVVGHFFLFCNIVRMRRSFELMWAALFVVNVNAWALLGVWSPWALYGAPLLATLILVTREVRSADYRGVLSERLNASLNRAIAERWRTLRDRKQ